MKNQFDVFTLMVVSAVFAGMLLLAGTSKFSGKTIVAGLLCSTATALFYAIARKQGAYILQNDYTGRGAFKCESTCKNEPLSNLMPETPIDGVATTYKPQHAYKLFGGMNARILQNGDVQHYSFISALFAPGWIHRNKLDHTWHEIIDYTSPPF